MGILRGLLRRNSILESNLVQTIGSAGESLAAGAIFTLPALFLWAEEGKAETPDLFTITALALCGGVLGVFFMVPLRKALIVKEHGVLPYPEGTACADVLLAGEEGGSGAKTVFFGMGIAALVKYIVDGMKVIPGAVMVPVNSLKTLFSVQVYPALMGVGYICGIRIASYMFAGAVLGWFVLIPAIVSFGGESILYPGTVPITTLYNEGGASAIWSSYIRYIGAGAVAAGGIISLVKTLPLLFSTFYEAVKAARSANGKGFRYSVCHWRNYSICLTHLACSSTSDFVFRGMACHFIWLFLCNRIFAHGRTGGQQQQSGFRYDDCDFVTRDGLVKGDKYHRHAGDDSGDFNCFRNLYCGGTCR